MKAKGKTSLVCLFTLAFLLTFALEVFARPPAPPPRRHPVKKARIQKHHRLYVPAPHRVRPIAPSPRHLWMPRFRHPSGVYIGGFWRPQHRVGYVWTDGYWNEDGVWVFGFWKPVKVRKGYAWVPGYWGGAIWVEGYWRLTRNPGFVWMPGCYNSGGIWLKGHWK